MDELIRYFDEACMPAFPLKLNAYMTVHEGILQSQLALASAGNMSAQLWLERLQDYLESQKANLATE